MELLYSNVKNGKFLGFRHSIAMAPDKKMCVFVSVLPRYGVDVEKVWTASHLHWRSAKAFDGTMILPRQLLLDMRDAHKNKRCSQCDFSLFGRRSVCLNIMCSTCDYNNLYKRLILGRELMSLNHVYSTETLPVPSSCPKCKKCLSCFKSKSPCFRHIVCPHDRTRYRKLNKLPVLNK